MSTGTNALLKELTAARQARPFDEDRYRRACETLIDNRDKLTHRVFIELPGGLMGNTDARWNAVRAGSVERCSCGNERTILPAVQRTDFLPSTAAPVVIADKDGVDLKPSGGDRASTYVRLSIEKYEKGAFLTFMFEPFSMILTMDLFSRKGYDLPQLAGALADQGSPMELRMGKERVPLCAISAVDAAAGTVTIILDKDIDVLTKEEADRSPAHQH